MQDESSDDEPGGLLASLQRSRLAFPKDGGKAGNMDRNMDDDSLVSLRVPQRFWLGFQKDFCDVLPAELRIANELLPEVQLPGNAVLAIMSSTLTSAANVAVTCRSRN